MITTRYVVKKRTCKGRPTRRISNYVGLAQYIWQLGHNLSQERFNLIRGAQFIHGGSAHLCKLR
jgi:hypothetical protein